MKNFSYQTNNDFVFIITRFCLYALPVLFIWQGIDVIDTGYALVQGNELMYSPSDTHIYGLPLTFLLNGMWLYCTDALGLGMLGARLGSIPVFWGIFYLSARILKRIMPLRDAYLFILLTFLLTFKVNWIYYGFLTVLFALWSALYIVKYEEDRKYSFLFFAGVLNGINVFVRAPNLLFILFAIIPIIVTVSSNEFLKANDLLP